MTKAASRGFAVFWVLALASGSLAWLEALAVHDADVDAAQVALATLAQKRVMDRDVAHVLRQALEDADGPDAQTRVADAVTRLVQAEAFLESAYARFGVQLDLFFGFLSEGEHDSWLQSMAQSRRLQKCPRCLDLSTVGGSALASVLSVSNASSGVVVSRNALHRAELPFVPFGRPVLGALYAFGDVIGVVVI